MTAKCTGGTSAPKPGVTDTVSFSAGLLAARLFAVGLGWLSPAIPLLALAPVAVSTFCASDPPAVPSFTSGEALALATRQLASADFLSGISKLGDLLLALLWEDLCECTSGTLVVVTPPARPTGTPVFQPPTAPGVVACASETQNNPAFDFTGVQNFNLGIPTHHAISPTSYVVHCVNNIVSGGGISLTFTFEQYNVAESTILAATLHNVAPGASFDMVIGSVSTFDSIHLRATGLGGAGHSNIVGTRVDWYCNNDVPGPQQPCCPPDTSSQSYLDAILQIVTLIQRQGVPFGYQAGTVHAGLTGQGHFAVSGLIGVKVEPASIPGWVGSADGDPDTLWLDSWINWGNADGWTQREWLRNSPYLSLPPLAGQFTKVGYSLADSLTVSITELVREA